MDHVKYLGEGSHHLDRYGPIKINVIGRWSNIGLGDQILHGFNVGRGKVWGFCKGL